MRLTRRHPSFLVLVRQLEDIREAANVVEDLGRGNRARNDVSYTDGLTENEFLRAVEDGSLDEAVTKKRAGGGKRRSRSARSRADNATSSPAANNLPHGECSESRLLSPTRPFFFWSCATPRRLNGLCFDHTQALCTRQCARS
jgi:hypothetical protein